ncbi:MAG: 50S ribosomal protein L23 [Pelagibacterales bacterium]|nr:50S ribosomal protein L23 [Pelagibacterales bacterium]PPR15319.1 MAG: 50S ribosomal protein L23 [Alphaproteobacteria bacterium MarineAlpha9_Bin3]|tara:strand:+ start:1967 stop:2266 length:300 start_codon:yes stop_codon:yes gene_type:complete
MANPKPQDFDVIVSPIITEKATRILENNQVVFKVSPNATKPQIKVAVEALFGVKVVGVNTLNIKGKNKVFKGIRGKRASIRKAMVTLAEGQTIDLSSGV